MKTEFVDVMGSAIQVVYNEQDEMFVSVRHVCLAIGIDPDNQRKKLLSNPVYEGCAVINTVQDASGRGQEMLCLALSMVAHWLSGIHPSKVAEHVRPYLVIYQRECAKILYNHFMDRHYRSHMIPQQPQAVVADNVLAQFITRMEEHFTPRREFDELKELVEELRYMLNVLWTEDEVIEVQQVIKETKEHLGWDGRKLLGYIRSGLNTQRVYAADMKDKVINMCKQMVGAK